MKDTQKDMVTTSKHNDIDTIEIIVLGEEDDMQDDLTSVKMIATHYNKNHHSSYMELVNVIFKEGEKHSILHYKDQEDSDNWKLHIKTVQQKCRYMSN